MKRLFGPLTASADRPKGGILALLILMSMALSSSGQSVVNQLENVKKPGMGKLYFSKKDSGVYVWKGKWSKVLQETGFGSAQPPITNPPVVVPPVVVPPVLDEIPLGYWDAPDRLLVAKLLDGKYHLLQTNAARSYYVPRGKNLLSDSRTKVNSDVLTGDLLPSLVSGNSDLGGLYPPATFKDALMTAKGFVKNGNGEWVLRQAQDPVVVVPPVLPDLPAVTEKIKVPVGVIFWDNWVRDYWNDVNPKYDYLINHISRNRYSATYWMDKFNLVPFYGQYHAPEKIKVRYNVKWSPADGRNIYDERELTVQVKFDKTAADTEREVKYYKDAGFDWICFVYYNTDSYLSEARQHFVAMKDKLGMKMTYMLAADRSDSEIDIITSQMMQDYWFRINGKPVLYFSPKDFEQVHKYRASLAAKGGGDIYAVWNGGYGLPGDWNEMLRYRNDAVGSYVTGSSSKLAEDLINGEVESRERWMGQFKSTHVQVIPTVTTALENLDKRTDLDAGKDVGWVVSATMEQLDRKNRLVGEFVKKYPDKVPAILWYAGNELLESGQSLVPKRRRDGSIDSSVLDLIGRRLE